jgi:predicted RNA binding protein YcfA (HicA-like mRNA interferase family)
LKLRNDIINLAKRYGFVLHREKKHFIFKDAAGRTMVCGKTISDRRALKNIEQEIKRILSKP